MKPVHRCGKRAQILPSFEPAKENRTIAVRFLCGHLKYVDSIDIIYVFRERIT